MAGGLTRIGVPRTAGQLAGAQAGAWARRAEPAAVFLVAPPVRDDALPVPHPVPVPGRMWGPRILADSGTIAHRVRPGAHGGHDWCWHLREGAKRDLMAHMSEHPGALAPFGIRTIDPRTIEVPDSTALNGLLQALGRPPLYYGCSGDVSRERYARGLADGLLPAATVGYFFFHDLGDHAGALFFPPECFAILSAKVGILLAMAKDRRLPLAVRDLARHRSVFQAEAWDNLTDLESFLSYALRGAAGNWWKRSFTEVLGASKFTESWGDRTTPPDVAARLRTYKERFYAACATPERCAELLAQTIDQATNGPLELRR